MKANQDDDRGVLSWWRAQTHRSNESNESSRSKESSESILGTDANDGGVDDARCFDDACGCGNRFMAASKIIRQEPQQSFVMKSPVNVATSLASLLGGSSDHTVDFRARQLQEFTIPNYTSPPTAFALSCTPEAYRSDDVIDAGRDADANGTCFDNVEMCQIPFVPSAVASPEIGVVFYGGGLVDPRGYSPLAKGLSDRYGIAVALQIFDADVSLAIGKCATGRLEYAQALFPSVKKWTLSGHSFGGVAAMADLWSSRNESTNIGGLVLLGSSVARDFGCGQFDFSDTFIPMATVNASLDLIMNATNYQLGLSRLPENDTFVMEVLGGNHQQFGSYDDSGRLTELGQVDGNATIPESVQLDLSISAIAHVASRMGIPLAELEEPMPTSSAKSGRNSLFLLGAMALASVALSLLSML